MNEQMKKRRRERLKGPFNNAKRCFLFITCDDISRRASKSCYAVMIKWHSGEWGGLRGGG